VVMNKGLPLLTSSKFLKL